MCVILSRGLFSKYALNANDDITWIKPPINTTRITIQKMHVVTRCADNFRPIVKNIWLNMFDYGRCFQISTDFEWFIFFALVCFALLFLFIFFLQNALLSTLPWSSSISVYNTFQSITVYVYECLCLLMSHYLSSKFSLFRFMRAYIGMCFSVCKISLLDMLRFWIAHNFCVLLFHRTINCNEYFYATEFSVSLFCSFFFLLFTSMIMMMLKWNQCIWWFA